MIHILLDTKDLSIDLKNRPTDILLNGEHIMHLDN